MFNASSFLWRITGNHFRKATDAEKKYFLETMLSPILDGR
jgi:hypothetical protein